MILEIIPQKWYCHPFLLKIVLQNKIEKIQREIIRSIHFFEFDYFF